MRPDPSPGPGRGATRRPFGLLDATLVVAFAAVGFAIGRQKLPGLAFHLDSRMGQNWRQAVGFLHFDGLPPLLMTATALALALRLRRPRPRLRRVASEPGASACLVVLGFQAMNFAQGLAFDAIPWIRGRPGINYRMDPVAWLNFLLSPGGWWNFPVIIPVAWALLVLQGRYRPEPTWPDRLGRAVGWSWILWGLATPVIRVLPYF